MNTVTVAGNLTRDPEVKVFATGSKVTTFSIAVNRKGADDKEFVSYLEVNAWNTLGENCASLPKGARVVVFGRLDQRSWEDQEGKKHSKIEITASEVSASLMWATVAIHKNPSNSKEYESSYEATAPAPRASSKAAPKGGFDNDLTDDDVPWE